MREALDYKADGRRKRRRPKCSWKRYEKEKIMKIGLKENHASNRVLWKNDVWVMKNNKVGPANSVNGDKIG